MFARAKKEGMFIRAYISMAFTCSFQGPVTFDEVRNVCERFI
jgi:hydroxymethylglutaryl-CoA lyase